MFWRSVLVLLLLLTLAGVIGRLMLPSYLRLYVNRVLDQSPDYDGRVGKIDVNIWRGQYAIRDLSIVKTTHTVAVPFFEARRVGLSVDWNALFDGYARGKIVIERPRLNFVDGPSEEEVQTGADQPWLAIINDLFPFRIDKAEITDGEIHFLTFRVDPEVDVYLSEVTASVTNLTNVQQSVDPHIATVKARGTAMESGSFRFEMNLDPRSYRPSFTLAMQLLDVDVTRLDALTRAYGDFDFESGLFDLVVEITTQDGVISGYTKPLFRNLKVLGPRDFKTDDPFQLLWEALVGAVGTLFKNQDRNQFGTSITLEGSLDDPRTSVLEAVGNVLRNAFVRAYLPRFERRLRTEDVTANSEDTR